MLLTFSDPWKQNHSLGLFICRMASYVYLSQYAELVADVHWGIQVPQISTCYKHIPLLSPFILAK